MNRELIRATEEFHFRDADEKPSESELLPKSKRTCAECIDSLLQFINQYSSGHLHHGLDMGSTSPFA